MNVIYAHAGGRRLILVAVCIPALPFLPPKTICTAHFDCAALLCYHVPCHAREKVRKKGKKGVVLAFFR